MISGNKLVIFRNPNIDLTSYSSKNFYISHIPPASLANEYLGAVKIAQSNDQSTILILSFLTENRDLGVDFLNALMQVYDSLNIESKNRISVNSLNFINENLDTLDQLNNLEGSVKNYRVNNDIFDEESQSKTYLSNVEVKQK